MNIKLLKEDDYISVMNSENKKWREENVKQGTFKSFDGTKINYYYAIPKERKGNIMMFHGYSEFFGKYHEMAWYFFQEGYAFFFMEMRGHGYSQRFVNRMDYVWIDTYDNYVDDQKAFYDKVVKDKLGKKPLYLFCHSMGGAVGALFLEKYPDIFKKAVLSSPMLQINTGSYPRLVARAVMWYARRRRLGKMPGPGQREWDPDDRADREYTYSKARYDYIKEMQLEDVHHQTCCATFGWMDASFKADRKLVRNASKCVTPVLLFQAGADTLVTAKGQNRFAKKAHDVTVVRYEKAAHEIFSDAYDTRVDYFTRLFTFLQS